MKTPKIFIGALIVYCIIVCFIGITNGADASIEIPGIRFGQDSGFSNGNVLHITIQQHIQESDTLEIGSRDLQLTQLTGVHNGHWIGQIKD